MREYNNQNGFTLIELAIVLVIIGMLVGLGANMIGPLNNFVKVRETRDIQDAAIQSIISWASSRNTIPNTGNNVDGSKSVAKSPNDAWGREMAFMYYSSLRVNVTKDSICGRRSTPVTLKTYENSTVTGTVSNVVFAVLSAAENVTLTSKLGADLGASTLITSQRGIITDNTIHVIGPNSDLARWLTLDELRSKVGCQGAPLRIVNNELPSGKVGSSYPAVSFTVDGGATPGTFRWCIEASTASPLPTDILFNTAPQVVQVPPNSCNGTNFLAEGSWNPSATLSISGTPAVATQGSYSFTVYVRDNNDASGSNDNIASKTYVLTINPQ